MYEDQLQLADDIALLLSSLSFNCSDMRALAVPFVILVSLDTEAQDLPPGGLCPS